MEKMKKSPLKASAFDPEKIHLLHFKLLKGEVESSDEWESMELNKIDFNCKINLLFNESKKLIRSELDINLSLPINTSNVITETKEAYTAYFQLGFLFQVDNFEELSQNKEGNELDLDIKLLNSLLSITYSTSRGILLSRLQGTAFQKFILPIADPKKYLVLG